MPSPFAAALAAAEPLFDANMGDLVRIEPVVAGDFGVSADGARPAFECAVLCNYVDPSAADVGKIEARFPYEETEIEIRYALLPAYGLRKEDRVVLLERPGQPVFKISRISDSDPERLVVTLSRLVDDE